MLIPDGFPGQRMLVLPRPRVREFQNQPGTAGLIVTDCGYFPRADLHGRRRTQPVGQAVVMACVDGSGWCETEAGRFPVNQGQVVVLPPRQPHAYGADTNNPWTLWWFHAASREVEDFLTAAGMTTENPVRRPRDLYPVVSLISEVVSWMERDTTTTSLNAAAGAAWHALTLLASERVRGDEGGDVIEHATAYLRAHIADRVTVPELAAMASLSTSHFSALFKRHVGYPVLQYQTMLRMSRARELLDTTSATVAAIAAEVGYPDSFYFARQFKKVHGMTAREYRDQHKG
ncbi:AraC family transcriptional regulator [Leifsonia shinshuensis]|uniref:AraC family transcriptional regulator n=1 Tax=Leifsonia shinshuensis TaxID=150026 RepID=UPI002861215C|nr:AraC family transcriptional regulator [Leifsonia shinshuensis]MDR6972913.1 AraC-like DNA-binding protein [Leifsonia shinshuensis]